MSNPNPPNKFKKGEPRPAGAGRRPGGVNHLTTARVKTESGTTGRPKGAMLTHGVLAAEGAASEPCRVSNVR
jgi:non-ribosomal peptide synthetase component F